MHQGYVVISIPDVVRRLVSQSKSRFLSPNGDWKVISIQRDGTRLQKRIRCPALLYALKKYLIKRNVIDDSYFAHSPSIIKSNGGGSVQEPHGDASFPGETCAPDHTVIVYCVCVCFMTAFYFVRALET